MKHKSITRMLSAVCAAATTLSLCGALSASAETKTVRIMGDITNDLEVSVDDAQTALNIYVETVAEMTDGAANAENGAGDVNMDGIISLDDATSILHYYCMTLVGEEPLWADVRTLNYADGGDYYGFYVTDENRHPVFDENGEPTLLNEDVQPVFPLKGLYIELGCVSGAPGEEVKVPVYVAGLPELAGFQLLVEHQLPLKLNAITSEMNQHPQWETAFREDIAANPNYDDNHGAIVMAQANNASLANGYVIATYTYQIPEDAQSGEVYALTVDTSYTCFVTEKCASYQYTTLSGVVRVQ